MEQQNFAHEELTEFSKIHTKNTPPQIADGKLQSEVFFFRNKRITCHFTEYLLWLHKTTWFAPQKAVFIPKVLLSELNLVL